MFSTAVAEQLRGAGHDAVQVREVGLGAQDDAFVAETARAEDRILVTENVQDFAGEQDLVLVFVLKKHLPVGRAQAPALARILDRWAQASPEPYLGEHWPPTDVG